MLKNLLCSCLINLPGNDASLCFVDSARSTGAALNDINHKQLRACATSEWVSKTSPRCITREVIFPACDKKAKSVLGPKVTHPESDIIYLAFTLQHILHSQIQKHFIKTGRYINLNTTSSHPHSLCAHKTISSPFPLWWLFLTYAELRCCRSNLLLSSLGSAALRAGRELEMLTHHYAVQR